ncbi:MAG: site-specific DNA-methyltransferase [Desulfobaccales bacterium]
MNTYHKLICSDSRKMSDVADESVDLIITSPPYPMIEMWDTIFGKLNPKVSEALTNNNGDQAFELMHQELDKVWYESFRVLKEGGFACINIGDATRTIGHRFQLYSNHSRIVTSFKKIGFDTLPVIIWRKQTNAPNKFMGSGMLPSGAYVTLEHEYILIFRKGTKRVFIKPEEILIRQKSSFFWEERNKWFSDIWFDLKGVSQGIKHNGARDRSAAFPFELAYRLINMYSVRFDIVLDPFMGTGTTVLAAMAACRNSIGIEIDASFDEYIVKSAMNSIYDFNKRISQRFTDHFAFIDEYLSKKGPLGYVNKHYKFPVMTRQEIELEIPYINSITHNDEKQLYVIYSQDQKIRGIEEITIENPMGIKRAPKQHRLALG